MATSPDCRKPEDATEALLDKMSKDSFPASDPPAFQAGPRPDAARDATVPAAVAALDLGEEVVGDGPYFTFVVEGREAVILRVVDHAHRLQLALRSNPLELSGADLRRLAELLGRIADRVDDGP